MSAAASFHGTSTNHFPDMGKKPKDDNRSLPTWATWPDQGEDAIASAINELFWSSASEAINAVLSLSSDVGRCSKINLTALSKDNVTSQPPSSEPFNPPEDEKAFRHIALCLLQTIGMQALLVAKFGQSVEFGTGLFDCSVLLEHRGDTLGTGVDALDWMFSHPKLRFATRSTLHWGNAHGSIIYGPLRFETGVKTEDSL